MRGIVHIVELVYVLEKNYPANPATCSIENWFDTIFGRVIQLDASLDRRGNMSPSHTENEPSGVRDHVHEQCKIPRYEKVRCCPEKPRLDVVCDILPVCSLVWCVIEYVEKDGANS